MEDMPLIAIENLSKTFTSGRRIRHFLGLKSSSLLTRIDALKEVSLNIGEGEFFGLMGPNGSGKTTLLKILATLILPNSGSARINGFSLDEDQKIKKLVGLVAGNERSFYWRLTGRQNLEFFAPLQQLSFKRAKKRIQELCDYLEIENPDRLFQEYSTGLKQRFALARALLHNPPILLLDEPTKSLDQKSCEKFRQFIQQLVRQQKKTVIYATHYSQEVGMFDRVGLLNQGKLVKTGKWSEVEKEYLC